MTKKCLGCGSLLQSTNPNQNGYVPKEKFAEVSLCARCFKINNYNQVDLISVPLNNQEILNHISKCKGIAFFMIDFLNLNIETLNTFKKITMPKILLISKADIIPKSIKETKIINWLEKTYQITNDIFFLSTKKNKNIHLVDKYLSQYHNIYLLGYTNAGKSTYLNSLINSKIQSTLKITTSMIPNTTLDFITISLDPTTNIIDSPGFTYQKTFYQPDEVNLLKRINPKRFLSPITYQLKEITSINMEDRLIVSTDVPNSLTFYLSNDLIISKIYNTAKYTNLPSQTYQIPANSDLVIRGIGFINIKQASTLTILSAYQELIEIRPSLFS